MKVQLINKHNKQNVHVGMRIGKFGERIVANETLQIDWKEHQPTVWNAENNFCAEVSEAQIKAIKEYFKTHFYFALKITDHKTFDNENTKDISYKGLNAIALREVALDLGGYFSMVHEILKAVSEGRLDMQDKKVVASIKRLMKIVASTKNVYTGEDSSGNCLYELSQK